MTGQAVTPSPKKSKNKILLIIALTIGFLGYKQYSSHYIWGADETAVDSTISAPLAIDTISNAVVADSTKSDTTKK